MTTPDAGESDDGVEYCPHEACEEEDRGDEGIAGFCVAGRARRSVDRNWK